MENHKVYLKMCQDLSNLSKCSKHKVGAFLVKNGQIISTGVNGTPKKFINCCDKFADIDTHSEPGKTMHRKWSEIFELHSEMSAILTAAKNGVNIEGSTLYCNLEPCFNCLKHAIFSGIKAIYYAQTHKHNLKSPDALELINTLGIKIKHISIE